MPRLSYDIISAAPTFTNALGDRQISLNSHSCPRVENLAITRDLYDTIDLSHNDIRRLDNFAPLKRLKHLLLHSNRLEKIDESVPENTPNLETLILSDNEISELGDLDVLSRWKNLANGQAGAQIGPNSGLIRLSLVNNPVTQKSHYRPYVIHVCGPSLRFLDNDRVTDHERRMARELFKGSQGEKLFTELGVKAVFEPGEGLVKKRQAATTGLSKEQEAKIKEAIVNATSMEEIERLEDALKRGVVPEGKSSHSEKVSTEKPQKEKSHDASKNHAKEPVVQVEDEMEVESEPEPEPKKTSRKRTVEPEPKRGKRSKSVEKVEEVEEEEPVTKGKRKHLEPEPEEEAPRKRNSRSRTPRRGAEPSPSPEPEAEAEEVEEEAPKKRATRATTPAKRGRGRGRGKK